MRFRIKNFVSFGRDTGYAFAISALIILGFWMLLSEEPKQTIEIIRPESYVAYVSNGGTEDRERGMLYDSEPLFLPTRWNDSAMKPHVAKGGPLFSDFEPQISMHIENLTRNNLLANSEIKEPADVLGAGFWNIFYQYSPAERKTPAPKEHTVQIGIREMSTGRLVRAYNDRGHVKLPETGLLWHEVIYMLAIEETGELGKPLLVKSSGYESVDDAIGIYLANDLLKLKRGYYRVSITP